MSRNLKKIGKYIRDFGLYFVPGFIYRPLWHLSHRRVARRRASEAEERVRYYVNLPADAKLTGGEIFTVGKFRFPWKSKHRLTMYFFDLYRTIRLFPKGKRFARFFGDYGVEVPQPGFVKARPITGKPTLSVLCQLNRFRHFQWVQDSLSFEDKKDMIVMRNVTDGVPWRQDFMYKYARHPMCDVGHTNHAQGVDEEFRKPFLSIPQQLEYKFIVCLQGKDVATNLKWVMSSNSLAVMPRPTIETWFMEGMLIPNYHYVEIKPDYSDLIERMEYYIQHPDEAREIIRHAHEHISRFADPKFEEYVQYLVMKRYFDQIN